MKQVGQGVPFLLNCLMPGLGILKIPAAGNWFMFWLAADFAWFIGCIVSIGILIFFTPLLYIGAMMHTAALVSQYNTNAAVTGRAQERLDNIEKKLDDIPSA